MQRSVQSESGFQFNRLRPRMNKLLSTGRLDDRSLFPRAIDVLLVNTNGHELNVLQSGLFGSSGRDNHIKDLVLVHPPELIVLQMYTHQHGVVRAEDYSPMEIFYYLKHHGYEMRWSRASNNHKGSSTVHNQHQGSSSSGSSPPNTEKNNNVFFATAREFWRFLENEQTPAVVDIVAERIYPRTRRRRGAKKLSSASPPRSRNAAEGAGAEQQVDKSNNAQEQVVVAPAVDHHQDEGNKNNILESNLETLEKGRNRF